MNISASQLINKMVSKLRSSQGDFEAGTVNRENIKSSLISVKVYCDLLLEELDEKSVKLEQNVQESNEAKIKKEYPLKQVNDKKIDLYEKEEDVNGDSIFDF
jgi:hypothetical protein